MSSVQQKLFPLSLVEAWDSLVNLPPSESVQQVRQSPGIVSRKKNLLPPSAHYKQAWIEKNVKTPLPGESGSKSSVQRADLQSKFFSLLVSQALRIRNKYFHKLKQTISEDDFVDEMWQYVAQAMEDLEITSPIACAYDMWMNGETSSRYWLEYDNITRFIRNAIASSGEVWDENKLPDLHAAASRGGKAFKKYDLGSHLATVHLSVTAAAKALGVARGTVYAMRREYADLDVTTGEVHAEEETSRETARLVAVESDRLGQETRNESRSSVDGLAGPHAYGSTRQGSASSQPSGVAESTRGLPLDFEKLELPF